MREINSKQVSRIQKYIRKNNLHWKEGLKDSEINYVKNTLKPKFYWIEAKSYIFHKYWSMNYYCITKEYFDSFKNLQ